MQGGEIADYPKIQRNLRIPLWLNLKFYNDEISELMIVKLSDIQYLKFEKLYSQSAPGPPHLTANLPSDPISTTLRRRMLAFHEAVPKKTLMERYKRLD